MRFILLLCLIFNTVILGFGQSDTLRVSNTHKKYRIYVPGLDLVTKHKGRLLELKDSSIVLAPFPFHKTPAEDRLQEILVKDIKSINRRRHGTAFIGMLGGAFVGGVVGFSIAGNKESDCGNSNIGVIIGCVSTEATESLGTGMLGITAGMLIGGASGGSTIKININGKQELYFKQKEKLRQFKDQKFH